MKLSEVKQTLSEIDTLTFKLPTGEAIPAHFHVTEVGLINKHFIDCGGTMRMTQSISFQLWSADDVDHRLQATKLRDIIALSEDKLGLEDEEVFVEYQSDTISTYGLSFDGSSFVLTTTQTDCLAKEKCGPMDKRKVVLAEVNTSCTPGGGCC